MNIDRISELGMEKVAANLPANTNGGLPANVAKAAKNGLSKKQLAALLGGGAAATGAGVAGYKKMDDDKKKSLKEQLKYRSKGALRGGAQGAAGAAGIAALGDRILGSKTDLKLISGLSGGLGATAGAINPQLTNVDASSNLKNPKEKQASAEELYIDGLQKIASVTGIEPEVLDEAIGMYNEDMTKEAQIDNFVDSLTEDQAEELLKEAAQSSPELKGKLSELEEEDENNDLAELVQSIEGLNDEDAEKLLEEIE
jgi:hypothetical protein